MKRKLDTPNQADIVMGLSRTSKQALAHAFNSEHPTSAAKRQSRTAANP
jgi:hypothetical protein